MADDFTILNSGVGGDAMDEEGVAYGSSPTTRKRARVQITGATPEEIARVVNEDPDGSEYGVIVRNVPSGNQAVTINAPGTQVYSFDTIADIPSETATDIVSFEVPADRTFRFSGVIVGGQVDAFFSVYCGSYLIAKLRNSTAQPTCQMHFTDIHPYCPEGDTVRVEVTHTNEGILSDFEATILGWYD